MRILVLNYEYPPASGGAGSLTKLLVEQFSKKQNNVDVVTTHSKNLPLFQKYENVEIWRIPVCNSDPSSRTIWQMIAYAFLAKFVLFILMAKNKYQSVHVHFLYPTGLLIPLIRLFHKGKIILTFHGGDIPSHSPGQTGLYHKMLNPLSCLILKMIDNAVVINNTHYKLIKKDFPQILPKLSIIPNGIRIPHTIHKRNGAITNFVFVGRLSPEKNVGKILKILSKIESNFKFHIIGDGRMKNHLKKLTQDLFLEDNVIWYGWLNTKEIKRILLKSHFMLMHSDFEGLSISALEAMSYGIPVISNDCEGMRGLVENGVNGFICRTSREYINRIESCWKLTKDEYNTLMRMTFNKVKKYSITEVSKEYLKIMEVK